jgi:hypothetical protein
VLKKQHNQHSIEDENDEKIYNEIDMDINDEDNEDASAHSFNHSNLLRQQSPQ